MGKKTLFCFIVMLGLAMSSLAAGVDNDNPTMQQSVENRDYSRLEKELQEKKDQNESNVIDKTAKQSVTAPDASLQIFVKKIVFGSSEILSSAEITEITKKYEGRLVNIKDLYQALKEIDDLYLEKGFITAKAILPPQKIEDGVVYIKLVEAHFGQFLLEGNEHTHDSYFFKRLSQREGDLVSIKTLEQDIFYFNRTNDVQIRAELKPGSEFGLTDCVLKVIEPDNLQGTLFTDNEGTKVTGEYRLGFSFVNNSLSGNRDFLVISPLWAEGNLAWSVSYNWPITTRGTRLGFTYSNNQSSVISGPFDMLDIRSDETDIGLNLSHPLRVKPNFKLDGFASFYNKESGTEFLGNTLRQNQINSFSLGLALQTVDENGFWYSRYEVTSGESDINGDFLRFNLSAIRQQKLKNDRLLVCRMSGQLSGDKLLPSTESFSLGGINTVRGCSAGTLSGDQGYNVSLEYSFPFHSSDKWRGFYFIDHGGSFPYKGNDENVTEEDYLTSVGFGVNFTCSKYFSGKLIAGYVLDSPKDEGDFKIEFYLQSILF